MRLGILSDVHANLPALEAVIESIDAADVEEIWCLGDVIGYGAKPRECLEAVMGLCTEAARGEGLEPGLCLQGNYEYALLNSAEDFNPNARAAIEWTREELSRAPERERALAYWDFLDGLEPLMAEDGAMYAHGSPRDPVREYLLPRDARDAAKMGACFSRMKTPAGERARVCFVGHSHVPGIFYEDGRFYRPKNTEGPYDLGDLSTTRAIVNIGSVGQPRDGDPRLSYAIFDGQHVSFVRLEYDVAQAQADIRGVRELPDYLAERLGRGQ